MSCGQNPPQTCKPQDGVSVMRAKIRPNDNPDLVVSTEAKRYGAQRICGTAGEDE
jgi:hypothetical protein